MKFILLLLAPVIFISASEWVQMGSSISGNAIGDRSAMVSISANGQIIAIGGIGNDSNGNDSGHVRVFEWTGTTWAQKGNEIYGEASGDRSGILSISSDGSTVVIGADGNRNGSGHVRIFKWDNSNFTWTQLGEDINGLETEEWFGGSVSINSSGTIIAATAEGNNGNGNRSGAVRIFQWNGVYWQQIGEDIYGKNVMDANGGNSISLNGDGSILAIGAAGNDDNGSYSGHVRIFEWNGSSWQQLGNDLHGDASNFFGSTVSLNEAGNILAVGAYGTPEYARIFEWDGLNWQQLGNDLTGEASGDNFGSWISSSADGYTIAVGANGNDGGGTNSGHARIFKWDGLSWNQLGADIDGHSEGARSGSPLSLNSYGSVVAIGGLSISSGIAGPGLVSIYALQGNPPVLDIESFHESESGDSILIDATPIEAPWDSYNYQWSLNGVPIPAVFGGSNNSFLLPYDSSSEGTWEIEVSNGYGSTVEEFEYRLFFDTDSDGFSDYRETHLLGTNPLSSDTDLDGLSDYKELETYGSDPTLADSNGDGFSDGSIINSGLSLSVDYSILKQDLLESVVENPNYYNLYSLQQVQDLRPGSTMIEVSEDQATVQLQMEESSDLQTWEDTGTPATMTIPADTDTKFFRFKMSE